MISTGYHVLPIRNRQTDAQTRLLSHSNSQYFGSDRDLNRGPLRSRVTSLSMFVPVPVNSRKCITASASRRRFRYIPDDDGMAPSSRRALAEASLGTLASADQVARSIMFRFRAPHIPQLVEKDGRMHFQLRACVESTESERICFDYDAHIRSVAEKLNSWLVCGTICDAIMNASPTDKGEAVILDIQLEVRTTGIISEEWNID